MLLIILALFWVALLAPVVVRRLKDGGAERSIESFHHEHETLSHKDYRVTPVHRLDTPDEVVPLTEAHRPRLTVVHADDTYGSLESRSSWDDWSRDYEYEQPVASLSAEPSHRYGAYAKAPVVIDAPYESSAPYRRYSMRARRRVMFTRIVVVAVVITSASFFTSISIVADLAYVAWLGLVAYFGLAAFAVWQGLLSTTSITPQFMQRRSLATIQPLRSEYSPDAGDRYEDNGTWSYESSDLNGHWRDEFDGYEPSNESWSFPERRRAIG